MLPIAALLFFVQNPAQGASKANPALAPEAVVQRHVEAYNAKDMNALLTTLDLDIKFYAFPDKVQIQGKTDCANAMRQLFTSSPDLKLDVSERMVCGSRIIDHEWIKGRADGRLVRGVSIYEVRNGVITKIWFAED